MSQFHLRLPPELRDLLRQAGENNGNSLNSEILNRLARSFDPDPATRLADKLRPHLAALGDDGDEAIKLIVNLFEFSSRTRSKSKRR